MRSTPALGIRKTHDRVVSVEIPGAQLNCEMVVNAAGPWAGQVGELAGLHIPVRPFRRCVYMTEPYSPIPRDIPMTIDVASDFYMRKENERVLLASPMQMSLRAKIPL